VDLGLDLEMVKNSEEVRIVAGGEGSHGDVDCGRGLVLGDDGFASEGKAVVL
jgi:hypothetical protein